MVWRNDKTSLSAQSSLGRLPYAVAAREWRQKHCVHLEICSIHIMSLPNEQLPAT